MVKLTVGANRLGLTANSLGKQEANKLMLSDLLLDHLGHRLRALELRIRRIDVVQRRLVDCTKSRIFGVELFGGEAGG